MIWNPLEHIVWKQFKNLTAVLSQKHFFVGLSGGADSVALLLALKNLQPQMQSQLTAIYVHHGIDSANSKQSAYRDQCELFCRNLCEEKQIDFKVSERPKAELRSEEEFREFRYEQFNLIRKNNVLVLAHHVDDLLETRMMRLIRGTGSEGLLAMEEWQRENQIWRPFLQLSKAEILTYLNANNLNASDLNSNSLNAKAQIYLEDPSNQDPNYLRNWLRTQWLPQLEQKVPGATLSLARSLDVIANQLKVEAKDMLYGVKINQISEQSVTISKQDFLALGEKEQKHLIAKMLKSAQVSNYSLGLIEEIKKNLDNPQGVHTFKLSHSTWEVDVQHIQLSHLQKSSKN